MTAGTPSRVLHGFEVLDAGGDPTRPRGPVVHSTQVEPVNHVFTPFEPESPRRDSYWTPCTKGVQQPGWRSPGRFIDPAVIAQSK